MRFIVMDPLSACDRQLVGRIGAEGVIRRCAPWLFRSFEFPEGLSHRVAQFCINAAPIFGLTFNKLNGAKSNKPSFESIDPRGIRDDRDEVINQPYISMLPDVRQHRAGCTMYRGVQCRTASLNQCGFGPRDGA